MQSPEVVCVVLGQGTQIKESEVWSQVLCNFIWDETHGFTLGSSFL